jgi:hypothetical protein
MGLDYPPKMVLVWGLSAFYGEYTATDDEGDTGVLDPMA